jgi:hypothetical protein
MARIEYRFELVDGVTDVTAAFGRLGAAAQACADAVELSTFLSRVRPPLSGWASSLYSRLDAAHRASVERRASVAFQRGWV